MYYLNPNGDNQSADGAAMQRESLLFKTGDRIDRVSPQWSSTMAVIFTVMGDTSRADLSKLQTLWASPARLSLAEKASAAAQVKDIIPWRSLMTYIFDFDPETIERMESEREEEQLAAMQRQQLLMAQTQQDNPDNQGDGQDNQDAGLNTDVSGLGGGRQDVSTGRVPPQLAR